MPQIGPQARALIVSEEITSEEHYRAALSHPTWPGGDSGVTIGIGYDLGYHTWPDVDRDWCELLLHNGQELYDKMRGVVGLTGREAQAVLPLVAAMVVPLEVALPVFTTELATYGAETARQIPMSEYLPAEAFGVLVSIGYNRGNAGWREPDDRHSEMRAIRDAVGRGNYPLVPDLILRMKRLWTVDGTVSGAARPGLAGLLARRDQEAALFQRSVAPLVY